jgi:hypothetical protein
LLGKRLFLCKKNPEDFSSKMASWISPTARYRDSQVRNQRQQFRSISLGSPGLGL